MGKVIKVIDLLNMIAKGEDLPRIIKYRRKKYYLYTKLNNLKWYWKMDTEGNWGDDLFIDVYGLNEEVEILDEEQEIDIQSIEDLKIIETLMSVDERVSREENLRRIDKAEINFFYKINDILRQQNKILQWAKQLDNKIKEK